MLPVVVLFLSCAPTLISGYCDGNDCKYNSRYNILWLIITIPLVIIYYWLRCCYVCKQEPTVIREVQVVVIGQDDSNQVKPSQSDAPPAYPENLVEPPSYSASTLASAPALQAPSAPSSRHSRPFTILPSTHVPYKQLVTPAD